MFVKKIRQNPKDRVARFMNMVFQRFSKHILVHELSQCCHISSLQSEPTGHIDLYTCNSKGPLKRKVFQKIYVFILKSCVFCKGAYFCKRGVLLEKVRVFGDTLTKHDATPSNSGQTVDVQSLGCSSEHNVAAPQFGFLTQFLSDIFLV